MTVSTLTLRRICVNKLTYASFLVLSPAQTLASVKWFTDTPALVFRCAFLRPVSKQYLFHGTQMSGFFNLIKPNLTQVKSIQGTRIWHQIVLTKSPTFYRTNSMVETVHVSIKYPNTSGKPYKKQHRVPPIIL